LLRITYLVVNSKGRLFLKKPWKTTVKPLNEEESKWEIIVHLGFNPETNKYDRRYKWIYATKEREIQAATREFVSEIEKEMEEIEREKDVKVYSQEILADWFTYWLNDYVPVFYKWERNTHERAVRIVNKNIIPGIGYIPISELEPDHIIDFYVKLFKEGKKVKTKDPEGNSIIRWVGLSNRSVRYVHVILNQSLNDAVTKKKISANPANGLNPAADKEKHYSKWVVLSEEQLLDFLAKSEGHRDFALIHTAAYSGCRQSELLGLTKDKILWKEKALRIEQSLHLDPGSENGFEHRPRTKNDPSTRTVNVTEDDLEVLRQYISKQKEAGIVSELVFTEPDGENINRNNLGHRFSNLARKNGHPGMTFHHMRHSHATILLSNGANINEVAERLGHADPTITLAVYGHVLPGRHQQLAEHFASLIKPKEIKDDSKKFTRKNLRKFFRK